VHRAKDSVRFLKWAAPDLAQPSQQIVCSNTFRIPPLYHLRHRDCDLSLFSHHCGLGSAPKSVPRLGTKTAADRTHRRRLFSACLALIAIVVPSNVQFLIAGANFTVGRLGIILLLIPAILELRAVRGTSEATSSLNGS